MALLKLQIVDAVITWFCLGTAVIADPEVLISVASPGPVMSTYRAVMPMKRLITMLLLRLPAKI